MLSNKDDVALSVSLRFEIAHAEAAAVLDDKDFLRTVVGDRLFGNRPNGSEVALCVGAGDGCEVLSQPVGFCDDGLL